MSEPGYTAGHPAPVDLDAAIEPNLEVMARGLWGYYKFEEDSGATRADSSGKGHDFTCHGSNFTRDEGNSTPFAAVLDGSMLAESQATALDGLVTPWGFVIGLRPGAPEADANVLIHGAGTDYACGLRMLWNGSDLVFRMQTGYRYGFDGEVGYDYHNDIVIPDLTSPIDAWYFVAGSFRGPSTSQDGPVTETLMTLRVNATINHVAAMALDAINEPTHDTVSDVWTLGENYVGRIGPLSIYERAMEDFEMASLYNGGDWLVLDL